MVTAGLAAVVGVLVAVVPVSVRDQHEVITCGPALLDGGPMADTACAQVATTMQTWTVLLLLAAGVLIAYGIVALRAEPSHPASSHRVGSAI